MRRLAVTMLVCLLMGGVAGCGGFYAKPTMASYIDVQALRAQADMAQAKSGTLTDEAALTSLGESENALRCYAEAKTTNLFVYWFDKTKTILVSPTFAERLDRAPLLVAEGLRRATTKPTDWRRRVVIGVCNIVIDVQHAKNGSVPKE